MAPSTSSLPSGLARILDALPDGVCILDAGGHIVGTNDAWMKLASRALPPDAPAMLGADYFAAWDKAAPGSDIARGLRALRRGELSEFALEYPGPAATADSWIELRAKRQGDGDALRLVLLHRDITVRKEAERLLLDNANRYRELLDHMNSGVAVYRAVDNGGDFVFVDFNRAGERIDNDSRERLLERRLTETRPGVVEFGLLEALRRVWRSGNAEHFPVRLYRDQRLAGYYDNYIYRLPSGEVVAIFDNVTDQKRAEEAFQESEAVRRQALESSPDAVFAIDHEYRLLFNNRRHQRALEETGGTSFRVGQNVLSPAYPPDILALWRDAYDRALLGEELQLDTCWASQDGSRRVFENTLSPLRDAGGLIIGALVVVREVTERRRLEAERSAALARLAVVEEQERRRLSRELHDQTAQRLVALAIDLKGLETHLAAGQPPAHRIQSLRAAVDDLQQQVRQLAWSLRSGEIFSGSLESAVRDYAEDWSERSHVPVDVECRGLASHRLPPPIETTIFRVAQEALTNAAKHAKARRVSLLLERDATLVRLIVEDDGCGFDAEAPLETLPTGPRLGLLGMKERVALAGGTLLIESSLHSGTTVLVRIPLLPGARPT